MPKGPTSPVTKRQLATVRSTLDKLELEYEEEYDTERESSFFTVDTGTSALESLSLLHQSGLLTAVAVFGVRPPAARLAEVQRFVGRFNSAAPHGCVFVRVDGSVAHRTSVDYAHVKNLEPGYVAALIGHIIDTTPAIDLPLIAIAKGQGADEAIAALLQLEEIVLAPPSARPKPKRPAKKRAAKQQ